MKRLILIVSLLAVAACDSTVHVAQITLNKTELSLIEGDIAGLYFTIEPADASDKSVSWRSSDESVARVVNGEVTAVSPGIATISVITNDMNVVATCLVTVARRIYEISNIKFEKDLIELEPKETAVLSFVIEPENATFKDSIAVLWWEIESPYTVYVTDAEFENNILKFNPFNAYVEGVNYGKATVKVQVQDTRTHRIYNPQCEVFVKSYQQPEEVDLGLSVYWSSFNLCGSPGIAYGPLFAWGDTTRNHSFSKQNYPFVTVGDEWTGKPDEYVNIGSNICATKYDAARVLLGNGWRLPTIKELQELCDNCTWEKETIKETRGFRLTGPSGKSIFLCNADGLHLNLMGHNDECIYWSGELAESVYFPYDVAAVLCWTESGGYIARDYRYEGNPIRPVKDKN